MTERIFKYKLKIQDYTELELPEGYRILTAQFRNDALCMWAIIEDSNEPTTVALRMYGTGHDMSIPRSRFIATAQMGRLVVHLFEVERVLNYRG